MITLKINIAMNGSKVGDLITLDTDLDGNIIDSFWFKRLEDSKRDNCVEVFQSKQSIKESKNADFKA